jgi:hypothetical protein
MAELLADVIKELAELTAKTWEMGGLDQAIFRKGAMKCERRSILSVCSMSDY